MQCFFNHFGSKHKLAKYYGSPREELVIEPFAGGANYSLYWDCRNVKLYDLDSDVYELWDYLINCSENDILNLPDYIDDVKELQDLSHPAALLISAWLKATSPKGVIVNSKLGFYKRKFARGETSVWCASVKHRIIRQKPLIKTWTIENCSYEDIPDYNAHYFIDPPYRDLETIGYKHGRSGIDYTHLGEWCRSRQGSVTVCEMLYQQDDYLPTLEPSPWLPFVPLKQHKNNNGKEYTEVYWSSDNLGRML